MVTDRVVTPVFLSTETAMRLFKALAMPVSSGVRRKVLNPSLSSPSASSSLLNRDSVQPTTLKGADITALHQGLRCSSFR